MENKWSMFEKIWMAISVSALIIASIIWDSPWYGFVSAITGIICVVLVAKGKISNYYFGIINCIFYAYVAYQWKLYGEVMLNMGYYLPMQFIGFYFWNKKENTTNNEVKVKHLNLNQSYIVINIIVGAVVGYAYILKSMGGNLPWIDSISTVISVVAMILMTLRYLEQWILWIVVDVVSIIMWITVVFKQGSNDIGILIMWIAYLANAIYGLFNWVKLNKKVTK